ncbi:MAG: hypothetical protein ACOZAM_30065 [Pseudomonadota bacterium]
MLAVKGPDCGGNVKLSLRAGKVEIRPKSMNRFDSNKLINLPQGTLAKPAGRVHALPQEKWSRGPR